MLAEVRVEGWRWLGAALAAVVVARSLAAAATRSAVDRRLAVGRTFAADLVGDGASLVHGRTGGRIDAGRYFERSGVLPDAAGRAYDRIRLGTTLGAAVVAAAAAALPLYDGRLTSWRMPPSLLALGVVGLAAFLLVSLGQALARRRGPAVPRSWGRPELGGIGVRRIWSVVAWSGAGIALETAGLAAALQGVGGHVPVPVTAAVYTVLRLCWDRAPGRRRARHR